MPTSSIDRHALVSSLAADVAAAITYTQLAAQLRRAIAQARMDGLQVVAVAGPGGSNTAFEPIGVAEAMLQKYDELARAETGQAVIMAPASVS